MKRFIQSHHFVIGIAVVVITAVVLMMFGVGQAKPKELVVTEVENGPVRQMVSVSGITEAKQSADLSFPTAGFVESVLVTVGDMVDAGDILLTLNSNALMADRQSALAELTKANAEKIELLAGPQKENRVVTSETIILKEKALATTKATEAQKVENALHALRSAGLTAYSNEADEDATAPTISGTYTCDKEGVYAIEMYSSKSPSGYSYRLSGLEEGTFTASIEQPIILGACGLRAIFDENSSYGNTTWYIEIPNTTSASYVTYKNAYELAKSQAKTAIELAEQELLLARATANDTNAPARSEAITRADATILQAEARLARIESELADRVLRAPFAGAITEINISAGEIGASETLITLLSENEFEVTARIPEIDIGKLVIGQTVEMVFDAKPTEPLDGQISFISLKPIFIDGVSYYEAYIQLNSKPTWLRSGLNADVDIILQETTDTLRVPKRFITENNGTFTVLKQNGETLATTTITVTLEGNDGFVAITGLTKGDTVVAP